MHLLLREAGPVPGPGPGRGRPGRAPWSASSRIRATRPLARVAYQSAGGAHAGASVGHPLTEKTFPSTRTKPDRLLEAGQLAEAPSPQTMAAVVTRLASTRLDPGGRDDGPVGPAVPGPRIDDVMDDTVPGPPCPGRVAGLARPPRWMATTWSACAGGVDDARAMPTAHPPAGGGPATATSPPRLTRAPAPMRPAMRAAARSAARPSRSNRGPAGRHAEYGPRDGADRAVRAAYPATGPSAWGGPGAGPHLGEVGVIAERGHRIADRGVDGPARARRRIDRHRERLEEQLRRRPSARPPHASPAIPSPPGTGYRRGRRT